MPLDEETREQGRRLIHQNQTTFDLWLKQQKATAEPDIGGLLFSKSTICISNLTQIN